MLSPLLRTDPARPRLTVYDEARGTRMEFSGQTLENWASKVANMLDEEFELAAGDGAILIDVPASWQAAVIALGTYASSRTPLFDATSTNPDVVFTTPARAATWAHVPDCAVVSDDPFGRGVVEAGGTLPAGTLDFGPTVRFYGDQYFGESPSLQQWAHTELGPHRYMVSPWNSTAQFESRVLAPLAADGSVVVATGLLSAERIEAIAAAEKVTHYLTED